MENIAGTYKSNKFISRKKKLFTGLACEKVNKLLLDADGRLFAGTAQGLFTLKNEAFTPLFANRLKGGISALAALPEGTVAAASGNDIYFIKGSSLKKARTFESEIVDIAYAREHVWVLTKQKLICSDAELKNDITDNFLEGGEGVALAVDENNMYAATESYLSLIHGKRNEWKNIMPGFSNMPEGKILSLAFDSLGYLRAGTENGAVIYDNASCWIDSSCVASLPKNPVYKTVFDACGGVYFATNAGVAYLKNGRTKYFSADRWVPDNKINDIAVAPDGSVFYAATDKGVSAVVSTYITLARKAEIFDDRIEKYHIRRGFTASRSINGYDMNNGCVDISDNDGLWTGCYVASQSFRYACTGSKEALEKARRGMKAMLLLTKVTGIPGFTARAVRYKGDEGYGNGDKEWHLSPVENCEWKGETSSDEMTGHYFGFSIYYDLCANEKEKKEIRKALCTITDHIVENNYRLVDVDGKPTTWACWAPDALNYDERWFAERGVNSLELLGFLKVSYHISQNEKYKKLYDEFVTRHRYPLNLMHHKVKDAHTCHIDDNLAFLATLTLLRLEENETLRSMVMCALEDHWKYERTERQPLFCVIHAAMTGRDDDIGEGLASLREIPFDLIHYKAENSLRRDLIWDTEQEEWYEEPQLKYALPYDERNVHRPDGSAFRADSAAGGAADPTIFLLPYWIGRYYGVIAED